MERRQLWVPIEFPSPEYEPTPKSFRWRAAIDELERKLLDEKVTPAMTLPLEIPSHGVKGWHVTRRSVSFRCLYQWAMMGTVNDPTPRFIGRVDVAFERPEVHSRREVARVARRLPRK
jgi:hypothetical protein